MQYLSDRVSIERGEGRLSVVISARLPRSREALLVAWTVAWALCGVYVLFERSRIPTGEPLRQYLLAFLAFWAYFLLVIGRATLWRLKGYELWRVKDGTLTIKNSLFGFGKAQHYFVENIQKMGLLNVDRGSWKWQWNESPWVIGGERLGFEYAGRKVVFGKNLTDDEARRLVPVLKDALRRERRTG
jgi:hypothetical protein